MNRTTEDILTLSTGCAFDRQQGGGGWHGVVDTTEEEGACVWEVRGGWSLGRKRWNWAGGAVAEVSYCYSEARQGKIFHRVHKWNVIASATRKRVGIFKLCGAKYTPPRI
jgi:hypothetical protein